MPEIAFMKIRLELFKNDLELSFYCKPASVRVVILLQTQFCKSGYFFANLILYMWLFFKGTYFNDMNKKLLENQP